MNKEILMVMRWLENSKSVSLEALEQNRASALAVYMGDVSAEAASYYAFRTATSALAGAIAENTPASYAYYGALHPDVPENAAEAHDHINEYFKFSDENKQDYLDELERTK
tara:strand:+ start:2379 stop:2711 length:333 start_codon:yes stop_codon:yes gene_type:complete